MTLFASQIAKAAHDAATAYYQDKLGGVDNFPCGFAWVKVIPEHKGNTREGKAERRDLEQLGFTKDRTGKAYELWNPSGLSVQNVDVLYAGAMAAADLMEQHGYRAYAGLRCGSILEQLSVWINTTKREDKTMRNEGTLQDRYNIYLACADDGTGRDICTGGTTYLATFDQWLNNQPGDEVTEEGKTK